MRGNSPAAPSAAALRRRADRPPHRAIRLPRPLSRKPSSNNCSPRGGPSNNCDPRFPEFPDSAFILVQIRPPSTADPLPGATSLASSIQLCPPSPHTSVDRAISKAVTAAEGISFQYVPLIQCSFPHADPKHATTFTRKNGWLELTLGTTRPDADCRTACPRDCSRFTAPPKRCAPIHRKFT